jgi:hypothetical protein
MTTTYTTTVVSMCTVPQSEGHADVVVNVQYNVSGTDGIYTANIEIVEQYTIQQGGSFIPYEQLTEAQVIGWISPSTLTSAELCVQGQINNMINPPVSPSSQPLPWSA